MSDKISVIIRSKNEARWIGHTIQSVLDFLNKPEIIIVDNHSTDETANIIRYFKQDPLLNDKKNKQYTDIKIQEIVEKKFLLSIFLLNLFQEFVPYIFF